MRILLNILLLLGVNILFYMVVYRLADYLMDIYRNGSVGNTVTDAQQFKK